MSLCLDQPRRRDMLAFLDPQCLRTQVIAPSLLQIHEILPRRTMSKMNRARVQGKQVIDGVRCTRDLGSHRLVSRWHYRGGESSSKSQARHFWEVRGGLIDSIFGPWQCNRTGYANSVLSSHGLALRLEIAIRWRPRPAWSFENDIFDDYFANCILRKSVRMAICVRLYRRLTSDC